jgi:hypothetical protein
MTGDNKMKKYSEHDIKKRENEIEGFVERYGEQLYHYTSISALHSIFKNKEFWFGSTAIMNDESENILFIQLLKNALVTYKENEKYIRFFDEAIRRAKSEYPFAMCFSRAEDDAAQWERYADNAKGCCFVINSRVFRKLFYFHNYKYGSIRLNEVFYGYDVSNHDHYRALISYFDTGKFNLNLANCISESSVIDNILSCASIHKHKSFVAEKEIRLVTDAWSKKLPEYSRIEFEKLNGRVRQFLKISMDKLCDSESVEFEDLFDQIVIAPRSEQSIYELKEYVASLGYNKLSESIVKSNCPLK